MSEVFRFSRWSVLGLSALALVAASVSYADEQAHEFYFQQQQRRFGGGVQNARTLGMGGSSVLTSSDSSSAVGNPAGLGLMQGGEVSGSYGYDTISGHEVPSGNDIEANENRGQVLAAIPLGATGDSLPLWGNLGMGWVGNNAEWDKDSYDTEDGGYQLNISYGKAINDRWSLGYGLNYINDEVKNDLYKYEMTNGFLHTLGAQYLVSPELKLGTDVQIGHGSRDLNFEDGSSSVDGDQFSVGVGVGAGYTWNKATTFTGAVDYTHYDVSGDDFSDSRVPFGGDSKGRAMNVRAGVEHAFNDWFKVRGGYRYAANFDWDYDRPELDDLSGSGKYSAWSTGAGLHFPVDAGWVEAINVDYGVEYRAAGDNDWQHLVTVSAPFDPCR